MKTIYFFIFLLITGLTVTVSSNAQQVRVNLYNAYTFDDDVETYTNNNVFYSGTIKGGYQWGIGVEYILRRTYGIELAYFRQGTDVDINFSRNSSVPDSSRLASIGSGLNFIMLGGNKYIPIPGSIVQPFAGLMVGLSIFSSDDDPSKNYTGTSTTNFAWAGRVGTNIMFSPNVGLRLHGQVMSSVQSVGGGLYFGTGGLGAGVDTESSMYQFGLGGALVIQFGSTPKPRIKR